MSPVLALSFFVLWFAIAGGNVAAGPRISGFGGDFALNVSSSYVLAHGGNPYRFHVLMRAERSYLNRQGIPTSRGPEPIAQAEDGYPPLYFWLLGPLTHVPFATALVAWIALLALVLAAGFVALLRYLEWSSLAVPTALFLIMPQSIVDAYYANPSDIVIGVVFLASYLQRKYPFVAGLLLSLAFLKPQIAVLALGMFSFFLVINVRRFLAGIGAGLLGLLIVTLLTVGPRAIAEWAHGVLLISRVVAGVSNISTVIGIYAAWVSPRERVIVELLIAALAIGLSIRWRARAGDMNRGGFASSAFPWVVCFLALPYAHFADAMILTPIVLTLIGRNGRNVTRVGALALYLVVFSFLLISAKLYGAQLLSVPLLILAALLYFAVDWPRVLLGTRLASPVQEPAASGSQ